MEPRNPHTVRARNMDQTIARDEDPESVVSCYHQDKEVRKLQSIHLPIPTDIMVLRDLGGPFLIAHHDNVTARQT